MADHNANKINLADQEESTPNGCNPQTATPTERDAPTESETLPADPPEANETEAISSGLPVPNPFDDVAEEAPLEAELRELAACNSRVQLTETYQVHTDTPARLSLTARRSTKITGARRSAGVYRDVHVGYAYACSAWSTHQ